MSKSDERYYLWQPELKERFYWLGRIFISPDFDLADLRRRVGMVFQKPNPFPQSVYDNVAFGPRVVGFGRRQI